MMLKEEEGEVVRARNLVKPGAVASGSQATCNSGTFSSHEADQSEAERYLAWRCCAQ